MKHKGNLEVEGTLTIKDGYAINAEADLGTGGGGSSTLDGLTDVDTSTTAPTTGDHLEFDGSQWVPGSAGGSAGVPFSGASVSLTADQTGITVNGTVVAFDQVDIDTDNYWDAANDQFIAPEDGYYLVTAHVQWFNQADGDAYFKFGPGTVAWTYTQGADETYRFGREGGNSSSNLPARQSSMILRLAAGDSVVVAVTGDASFDIRNDGAFFQIAKLQGAANQLSFVGCQIARSNVQNLSSGSYVDIVFDTTHFDSSSMFDGTSTITIPEDGKYMVHFNAYTRVAATLNIDVNSSLQNGVGYVGAAPDHAGSERAEQSGIYQLQAGDTIKFRIRLASTNDVGSTDDYLYASVVKLGQANHTHAANADTDWHVVGDAGEPAFENSWANDGAVDQAAAAFRKTAESMVVLKGYIDSGSDSTNAFTLPVDYRPLEKHLFVVYQNGGTQDLCRINILTDGSVRVFDYDGVNVSLAGITFFVEQ